MYIRVLKEALTSILSNKMRSFLTVLGIVIGVGAVIGMLSIGAGASDSILGQIESIGTNSIYVMPGGDDEITNPKPLTLTDANALSNRIRAPHILRVTPVMMGQSSFSLGDSRIQTQVFGSYPEYTEITGLEIAEGEFITASDVDTRSSVVVIGPDLAEGLFGRTSGVVGSTVRINNFPYRVVGVAKAQGGNQFNNPDLQAYMPITTMQLRVTRQTIPDQVQYIIIQAQDSQSIDLAISEAQQVLRETHRLTPKQGNDFTLTNQEDILDIANQITNILTIFLAGIAGISLLVGGIGIMNIMLVTVTERTNEIGLRKALGARKGDIMLQFLTESALLSLIGGIFGVILGWGLAQIVGTIARNSGTPLIPVVQIEVVLLATVFSTLVGVFFGWYPARQAASLQPVDALRYE
ncbi:MAG: ABC transporter permease [Anaerolineaceae bacterium]|nr:ABC transporter permease [Anaerolineaceae bacterium]MDD4043045.1 ABC transporter permease [Anaerolineaceae bacterium]MDD4577277.1 ABC transporter permease [Anaerolineaceae bacterium]